MEHPPFVYNRSTGYFPPEFNEMSDFNPELLNEDTLAQNQMSFDRDKPKIMPNSLLAKLAVPCQADTDYDYGLCYNYYANGCYNTCQFVEVDDVEDFM